MKESTIPRDALRDLTNREKFIAAAVHRLPGQPWSEILADVGMNASAAAEARNTLEALGAVEHYPQEYINRRGHTRWRSVWRVSATGHPWISQYDAWLNAGRPADSCPMPERYAPNFTPKASTDPATRVRHIPRGKIHSERQRLIETFLRNLGAPWSQIRIMAGIHLATVTLVRDELRLDGVLLACIDRYTDTVGRKILRTIFLPDEGNPEVIATRKQYGLVRPHTPQARRDALDPPHHGKDLTVPLSMFPSIVGMDEDIPAPPPAPTKLAEIEHQVAGHRGTERETPAPIKAQAPFKPLTLDIPTVPRTGGFLASLGDTPPPAPVALETSPYVIGIAVADTHDIDPAVEAVDETPEQETLGFTAWTFPDGE